MTKPWKEFRQEIVRLYIQEGRTLRDVQEIMRRHHGFNASVRSYRQQFDHWGVGKYKCKRRPQRRQFASTAIHPPSPPATPMLPPIAMSVFGGKPMMPSQSEDSGGSDSCWPAHRHDIHMDSKENYQTRSLSVSLPLSSPPTNVDLYHGQGRAYQSARPSLPTMSTQVDDTASAWMQGQGRSAFAQGDMTPRDNAALCSSRVQFPMVTRDQLSPIYVDSKSTLLGDVEWGVSRSATYPMLEGDPTVLQDGSRPRAMNPYTAPSPCALIAAKGFSSSAHLPLDRINVIGRDV